MSVSVVVPAYNEARDLPLCLESLAQQTVAPYEVIVVDNNSTDATADIAKTYGAIVVSEQTQGIAYARSAGFDAARGDIIARTDADCEVAPKWVETIEAAFTHSPNIVAVAGDLEFEELRFIRFVVQPIYRVLRFWHQRKFGGSVLLYGANFALRQSVWQTIREQVRASHKTLSEDIELSLIVQKQGKIVRAPDMKVTVKIAEFLNVNKIVHYYRSDNQIKRQM